MVLDIKVVILFVEFLIVDRTHTSKANTLLTSKAFELYFYEAPNAIFTWLTGSGRYIRWRRRLVLRRHLKATSESTTYTNLSYSIRYVSKYYFVFNHSHTTFSPPRIKAYHRKAKGYGGLYFSHKRKVGQIEK